MYCPVLAALLNSVGRMLSHFIVFRGNMLGRGNVQEKCSDSAAQCSRIRSLFYVFQNSKNAFLRFF